MSLCVPTRNRATRLRESLENLREQDYSPIEIVISDNCSEDDTEQVCREAIRQDPRIRYFRQERNIGLHRNHNFCLDVSRGDLLCICHDHDRRDPRIISEYVSFLEANPRVGTVCSDWDLIDDEDRQIGVRRHRAKSVTPGLDYIEQTMRSGRTSAAIPGAMVRRSALGDARFEADAPIGFGDFPLWFRVAETWDVGHIHEVLFSWRQNQESHSARTIESIAHDYDANLTWYCDEHLKRWPDHDALVQRWRGSIRHYLFWALGYEVALHFRKANAISAGAGERSLFDIMDYRLTAEQLQHALSQMRTYRMSAMDYVAYSGLSTAIALRLTWPVAWISRHQSALRTLLGLE